MLERPSLIVLAGVNGAGKSSVFGPYLKQNGIAWWYNPDEYAGKLAEIFSLQEANSKAWLKGFSELQKAVERGEHYAFETTLGGQSYTDELIKASATHDITLLYCGLATPALHIERVQQRVLAGGHPIPEHKILERWTEAPKNLIRLMPYLKTLQVFDNSVLSTDGYIHQPKLILEVLDKKVIVPDVKVADELLQTPKWARPILMAAIEIQKQQP